jgi:sortase A
MAESPLVKRHRILLSMTAVVGLAACGGRSAVAPTTAAPTTVAPTTAVPTSTLSLDTLLSPDTTDIATTVSSPGTDETLPKPEEPPPPDLTVPRKQIGSIAIPDIQIDEPMFEGVSLPTLNKGPGHWPGSALPGQLGNVVIAGHRVSHNHPFRDIDKLKPGNQVIFTVNGGRYVYLVRETKIVSPDALWIVEQTPTKTATLFACHPKGSTKKRIVVFLDYAPTLSTPAA